MAAACLTVRLQQSAHARPCGNWLDHVAVRLQWCHNICPQAMHCWQRPPALNSEACEQRKHTACAALKAMHCDLCKAPAAHGLDEQSCHAGRPTSYIVAACCMKDDQAATACHRAGTCIAGCAPTAMLTEQNEPMRSRRVQVLQRCHWVPGLQRNKHVRGHSVAVKLGPLC